MALTEDVEFGYATANIAKLDSVGGKSKPTAVTLDGFPVATHAPEQVGAGRMIKMVRIKFS